MHIKQNPLVSILVNCYNSEAFLQEAIDSIYAQTYQNFQILLVDNCSTDQTPIIAKNYDSRLVYIKTERLIPLYAARNIGLRHMKGDYLAFLDSDDVWLSNKLEKQLILASNKSIGFIYTNYGNIVEHSSRFKKLIFSFYLNALKINLFFRRSSYVEINQVIKNYDINLQTVLLKASLIEGVIFNEKLNLYGDMDFFLNVFLLKKIKPYYFNLKTSLSRVHEKQLSRKSSKQWLNESKLCFRHFSKLLDVNGRNEFLRSNILLHVSNISLENKNYKKAFFIKISLATNSIAHFIHFLKSSVFISKKLLSKH